MASAGDTATNKGRMGRTKGKILLREDIYDLQLAYDDEEPNVSRKLAMQKLLWAFHLLQHSDPSERDSFFQIAGYHGMPFRGAGWGNPAWWGGYCNHGNVLFPTWHRAYLVRLENALRNVSGYDDITLPYWNETGKESLENGIPKIFLHERVDIPKKGYVTKRYPYSGLESGDNAGATKQHNMFVAALKNTDEMLNNNVIDWLTRSIVLPDNKILTPNVCHKYYRCLDAPTYTAFSNTTSASHYNDNVYYNTPGNPIKIQALKDPIAVSLESPHNDIHLAVGGFDIPGQGNFDRIIGANGDMGENDTAAFDPIFYFHHCFIDKVFWEWQRRHGARNELKIDAGWPGTNSVDYQGPTPGVTGGTWLTMESPLAPFTFDDTESGRALTSNDVVNIEEQLGYWYSDEKDLGSEPEGVGDGDTGDADGGHGDAPVVNVVRVTGLNRAALPGSFMLVVRANVEGQEEIVGTESVLSRWHVSGCANCQKHLEVKAYVRLKGVEKEDLRTVRVGLHARGKTVDDINNDHGVGGSWGLGRMKMSEV
ncbi:tyrosinase [Nemania sp. FL0916]|nr:tyrosinase [Nemania sp. FL0916]